MLVTLSGMVTRVRLEQEMNAPAPMLVMLLGIVTLAMLLLENARSPILVTGRPSIVLGMTTSSFMPVCPVIVIVPLFVV